MKYDFESVIPRKGTGSTKWDHVTMRVSNPDALPLWVADSDFRCPEPVVEAVRRRAAHPIYGYAYVPEEFYQVTADWLKKRHGWQVDQKWVLFCPGVVPALAMAVQVFTEPGDEVIIQRPVYHPFTNVVTESSRRVSSNSLVYRDGQYHIDFEDFERRAASPRAKVFLLCNPHNPVGRVWTEEELIRLVRICVRNRVLIVSDEIHADLVYPGYSHRVLAHVAFKWADQIITCHAPSKTFNIPGLAASSVIISDPRVRKRMEQALSAIHMNVPNAFAMEAYRAAYSQCEDYLEQQISYLQDNISYVETCLRQMPGIRLVRPQATYLLWLDCTGMGLKGEEVTGFFVEEAALAVNPGSLFGPEGECFVRMNIACPREILRQAMSQLKNAYEKRRNVI